MDKTGWAMISGLAIPVVWFFILIYAFVGWTSNYEPDTSDYSPPRFGPSCVETATNGCTWAGQEVPKGSASDMIAQQKRTKTGLYAEK